MTVLAASCVVLAAVAVLWPGPGPRSRWRGLFGRPAYRRPWSPWVVRLPGHGVVAGVRPQLLVVAAVVGLATLFGGWVAGAVTGAYGVVAARVVRTRAQQRTSARRRTELLDSLSAAAADLRAGLAAGTALADLEPGSPDPLLVRVRAATRLAERTGAPLAELLERIEADARSGDRARAASAAQAAGSQATAWLLAALPAGGLGLGYAIGGDPLRVLLHTPLGAACALGAVALQLAGLAWSRRILRPAVAP